MAKCQQKQTDHLFPYIFCAALGVSTVTRSRWDKAAVKPSCTVLTQTRAGFFRQGLGYSTGKSHWRLKTTGGQLDKNMQAEQWIVQKFSNPQLPFPNIHLPETSLFQTAAACHLCHLSPSSPVACPEMNGSDGDRVLLLYPGTVEQTGRGVCPDKCYSMSRNFHLTWGSYLFHAHMSIYFHSLTSERGRISRWTFHHLPEDLWPQVHTWTHIHRIAFHTRHGSSSHFCSRNTAQCRVQQLMHSCRMKEAFSSFSLSPPISQQHVHWPSQCYVPSVLPN